MQLRVFCKFVNGVAHLMSEGSFIGVYKRSLNNVVMMVHHQRSIIDYGIVESNIKDNGTSLVKMLSFFFF